MSDVAERLDELRKLLAQKQNPTDTPQVKIISDQNLSLRTVAPSIQLAPYTDDSSYLEPDTEVKTIPISTQISTTYGGRKAEVITFEIASAVTLQPNTEYIYPINKYEDGEVVHFTVAVNDPSMRVVLTLYDDSQKPDPLCNESADDLVLLGRGMTHAEAYATDVDGVSIDLKGDKHSVMPYVNRFKHTFSYGYTPADYDLVAGTPNDRWFVIEYEPTLAAPYKKIFFTIQNKTQNPRIIHYARLRRYAFQQGFVQEGALSLNQPAQGQATVPDALGAGAAGNVPVATMARKARLSD